MAPSAAASVSMSMSMYRWTKRAQLGEWQRYVYVYSCRAWQPDDAVSWLLTARQTTLNSQLSTGNVEISRRLQASSIQTVTPECRIERFLAHFNHLPLAPGSSLRARHGTERERNYNFVKDKRCTVCKMEHAASGQYSPICPFAWLPIANAIAVFGHVDMPSPSQPVWAGLPKRLK